ncbi:exosortase A [Noviherbaspirillum sp. UKPF54]|uniref:exosortase A n=1 Tax=Noviherbaspirillum sp. UKPF54 TaxID=2601898 RepID=UPI0011B16022|nr:exosortase A [Noviherbaspirillum sp. UKPF54]QDZ28993.1 exosortase A [Noviherbaspirillum sp. UKPF54]
MSAVLDQGVGQKTGITGKRLPGAWWLAIAAIGAIAVVYSGTLASMVAVWTSSDTFLHGFLIAPISAYLIWQRRAELAALRPQPNLLGLLPLAALGVFWLLATLADVHVARQYAVVAMVPTVLWTVMGNRITAALAFPLGFLLFSVPFGDIFIPALIDLTADATVWALQLSGIPVFREGSTFAIPSGHWSVVEACSGIRYLIASMTLGSLYAYLTYRSPWRRLTFFALSILVPIAANSARAFLIVMIGHLSDMRLAVGVDHLIYGWIFFGVVMLLLFWIGAIWREDHDEREDMHLARSHAAAPAFSLPVAGAAIAALAVALIGPVWAQIVLHRAETADLRNIALPQHAGSWRRDDSHPGWAPHYAGNPAIQQYVYRNAERAVGLHLAYYATQAPGSGLVGYGNALVTENDPFRAGAPEISRTLPLKDGPFSIRQAVIYGHGARILVWRWYLMGGTHTVSPYVIKAKLAWNRLLGRSTAGAQIVLAAEFHDDEDEASLPLTLLLEQLIPFIQQGGSHAQRD